MSSSDTTKAAQEMYHSAPYQAAASAISSFKPLGQVGQQLCGLHVYATDPTRAVRAHHYCTHLRPDLHQCIIYDSDEPGARLIGVEYVVPRHVVEGFSAEERRYWHSHKYEVESGMLMLGTKSLVPNAVTDVAERPAMLELHDTYGKTVHMWQYDTSPDFPLGPPQLMMAYTEDSQVDQAALAERDDALGVNTAKKREVRKGYLPAEQLATQPLGGTDQWLSGKAVQLVPEEVDVRGNSA